MRKILATVALVLAFGCPALAGEIHIPPVATPPPPQNDAQEQTTEGEIHFPLTEFIFSLLTLF